MAGQVTEHTLRAWAARGIGRLSVPSALAALDEAVDREVPYAAVLPIDWPTFVSALDGVPPLLADLASGASGGGPSGVGHPSAAPPPSLDLAELQSLEPEARSARIAEFVVATLAGVLGLRKDRLDPESEIGAMGFDSLMAMEAKNRIESGMGVIVPTSTLLGRSTVQDIVDAVADLDLSSVPVSEGPALVEGEI